MFGAWLAGAPVAGWSKQMYESIYSLQNTVRRISYNTVDSPKYININKYYQGRAGRLHSSAQHRPLSSQSVRLSLEQRGEASVPLLEYAGISNSFNISITRAITSRQRIPTAAQSSLMFSWKLTNSEGMFCSEQVFYCFKTFFCAISH